jgi:hypothetical protein
MTACGGGRRPLLRPAWVLALAAALFFTAPAAPATADFVLDLSLPPSEALQLLEARVLDDGELAQIHARGLIGVHSPGTRSKRKIILWDEAYRGNLASPGPHMTPDTPGASNSVSRRGGW